MSGHLPVLLDEALTWLAPQPGGLILDGTAGWGGHAAAIARRVGSEGTLVLLDLDEECLGGAAGRVGESGPRVVARHAGFADAKSALEEIGFSGVDGVLLDLGVNSAQLEDPRRGFSFRLDGPLDMRLDPSQGETAADLVNRLSEPELSDLLWRFGEERRSRAVARAIVDERRRATIRTTGKLAEIVRRVVRGRPGGIDAATRSFQALRIAVNRELESLERFLEQVPDLLRPGGKVVVISFHSLEDRLVKNAFRREKAAGRLRILTRKPVRPGEDEVRRNPRSRCARLRAAARVSS